MFFPRGQKIHRGGRWLVVLMLAFGILPIRSAAADSAADAGGSPGALFRKWKQKIGFSAGYGEGFYVSGTRRSEARDTEIVVLTPQWGIGISDPLGGDSWYGGNFEQLLEGGFLINTEPRSGFAAGVQTLTRFNFLAAGRWVPFLEGGAGITALDFDLNKQSDGFNFVLLAGGGFHWFVSDQTAITTGMRYEHISNAGIHDENHGIDTAQVLIGFTFFPD